MRIAVSSNDSISLVGTPDEIEKMRKMMLGTAWMTVTEGVVKVSESFKEAPEPVSDPMIPPHWQTSFGSLPAAHAPALMNHVPEDMTMWGSPSFFLRHLIHTRDVETVQSWGFEVMRSRRGEDGKFWEVWYLPGDWAAKNDLKKFIETIPRTTDWENKSMKIIHWIAERVIFGSYDVVIQRMALSNPD
jgi:hypothetical protein